MRRDPLRDQIDRNLLNLLAGGKDYNPDQLRDPHTGEWIDVPGSLPSWDRIAPGDYQRERSGYLEHIYREAEGVSPVAWSGERRPKSGTEHDWEQVEVGAASLKDIKEIMDQDVPPPLP